MPLWFSTKLVLIHGQEGDQKQEGFGHPSSSRAANPCSTPCSEFPSQLPLPTEFAASPPWPRLTLSVTLLNVFLPYSWVILSLPALCVPSAAAPHTTVLLLIHTLSRARGILSIQVTAWAHNPCWENGDAAFKWIKQFLNSSAIRLQVRGEWPGLPSRFLSITSGLSCWLLGNKNNKMEFPWQCRGQTQLCELLSLPLSQHLTAHRHFQTLQRLQSCFTGSFPLSLRAGIGKIDSQKEF